MAATSPNAAKTIRSSPTRGHGQRFVDGVRAGVDVGDAEIPQARGMLLGICLRSPYAVRTDRPRPRHLDQAPRSTPSRSARAPGRHPRPIHLAHEPSLRPRPAEPEFKHQKRRHGSSFPIELKFRARQRGRVPIADRPLLHAHSLDACATYGFRRHLPPWQSAQNHPLAARPSTASLLKSPRSLPPRKAYRLGPSGEPGLAWPSASGLDHKHVRTPRRECEASSHHDQRPASFV